MRRIMILKIHSNDNSVKSRYFWHCYKDTFLRRKNTALCIEGQSTFSAFSFHLSDFLPTATAYWPLFLASQIVFFLPFPERWRKVHRGNLSVNGIYFLLPSGFFGLSTKNRFMKTRHSFMYYCCLLKFYCFFDFASWHTHTLF